MTDLDELERLLAKATPGKWCAGCQNDALFIVAGRAPALNNDHPWHEAPRVALAKMFTPTEGDCLPVNADDNAALIAALRNAAPAMIAELKALRRATAMSELIASTADEYDPQAIAKDATDAD